MSTQNSSVLQHSLFTMPLADRLIHWQTAGKQVSERTASTQTHTYRHSSVHTLEHCRWVVINYENVNQQYVHVKFFCRAHRTDGLQDQGVFLDNSNLHILMKDAHFPKDNINGKVLFYSFYLAESLIKRSIQVCTLNIQLRPVVSIVSLNVDQSLKLFLG